MGPVINLKKLNAAYLETPHFRMESPQDVCHAIRPGDWAASIDLKDAYFHVPIAMAARKYLCFGWRGRLYQFCILPFGLSPGGFRDQVVACPSPASTSHPARLHPLEEECSGGRSLEVPVSPRLAPRPRCFSPYIVPVRSTPDRSLCVSPVRADSALHVMESRGQTGSHRRAQHEVGLQAGLPLSPHSPPQEGYAEAGVVQGDVSPRHPVLGGPDLVRQSPGASSGGRPSSSLQRRPPHRPVNSGASSIPGAALPSRLEDLRGLGESTPFRTGPSGLSRQDGSDPQRTAMKGLGSPSRPSSALPPFLSIKRL